MAPFPKGRRGKIYDKTFTSIRDTLRRKNKEKTAEKVVTECFVDPTRMIAVSDVGGIKDGDIKQMIKDNKLLVEAEGIRVLESDNMYIKQAEHTLRTENFEAAGTYIMKALEQNPDSTKALNLLAKIHLLTNDWGNAIGAAELVLEVDKQNTKAINVKAEALFNVCQFERALVLFYRGMSYSTIREQQEMFRLGVQKCKRIIHDCIPQDPELFKAEGIDLLFKMINAEYEGHDLPEAQQAELKENNQKLPSINVMMKMSQKKKAITAAVREKQMIKEEEEISKQNVKTIMDADFAEHQRQKIREERAKKDNFLKMMNKGGEMKAFGKTIKKDSAPAFGMKTSSNTLKKKLKLVANSAGATNTLIEEYADAVGHKKKRSGNERLKTDRKYLNALSKKLTVRTDIKDDKVHRDINKVTGDVLLFLRQRDIFWDQLQSA